MRLKRIDIELSTWGEHKGKYVGKITFEDGQSDSFTFGLTPELCAKYMNPIAQEIVSSAKELGDKLAQSFTREIEGKEQINIGE